MGAVSEFVHLRTTDAHPGVGTIALTRPPTNALTRQAYREIAAAAGQAARRADVAAVVLYGGHEIFSAGDDVPELRTLNAEETAVATGVRADAAAAVAAIPKPTVAALTGYALGGGLSLALAADWRIAGDNVKFGATEILADLVPDADGLARLARAAGASRAKELVYSGRFIDAEEALSLGIIDDIVAPDGVYEAAVRWVGRFAEAAPQALAAAKAGIDAAFS
ncbi:enoyl-CoA hydratase [Mycolicibacillus parakoreensis]|uniref:Enoyl-CoA hydratase n=1 Tax=Mycolicibacillus parakoreensis TaxID=1069221 RepID=A0ABY3TVQ0_9MYCO|nr:enoyl-CoA hydratase [Mycolicibacillus parakoreensis]ULN51794.1 enoyl-CoA hydratase [Mycolicibacillus parakoreensis]